MLLILCALVAQTRGATFPRAQISSPAPAKRQNDTTPGIGGFFGMGRPALPAPPDQEANTRRPASS